jgi:glutathione S-transferase
MIDYYTAKTLGGNARKISIMLAETGLEHVVHFMDLAKGEQHEAWYLVINRNGKIPAIVDHDDVASSSLTESGAILFYLAEKTGSFLPAAGWRRARVLEWMFWQASGLGPMAGQWDYFLRSAPERVEFAVARYRDECARLLGVMDQQLADCEYVAGDYSIADMMLYSWVLPVRRGLLAFNPPSSRDPAWTASWPHVQRWLETVRQRPAVEVAMTRYEGTAVRIGKDVPAPLA